MPLYYNCLDFARDSADDRWSYTENIVSILICVYNTYIYHAYDWRLAEISQILRDVARANINIDCEVEATEEVDNWEFDAVEDWEADALEDDDGDGDDFNMSRTDLFLFLASLRAKLICASKFWDIDLIINLSLHL